MVRTAKTASSRVGAPLTKRQWLTQFNIAVSLMSVIPLLICCYLITVKFFSIEILSGLNGLYFLLAIVFAVLGVLASRLVVGNIVRQLVEANERLTRLTAAQAEFVSHVAHEFRAPLAIIKGALENLRDGLHGGLSEEQAEPVAMSFRETVRLRRIVGDLLDMAQLESGKLRLEYAECSLREIVSGVAQACQGLAAERGLRWTVELPQQPALVRGDRDRLSQVVMNLVTNAIKFTDTGEVRIRLMQARDAFDIEVVDTGPGIGADDLERIFQKFERAGDGAKEGSGLGLSIAKTIVELHQGRMWAESRPGQGSRFVVRLPALLNDAAQA